uniref:Uncharacterized protein n=1 Tax=Moniliophthora roreri TaxID=221103 RepID=A0A0W0GDT9_MONRR
MVPSTVQPPKVVKASNAQKLLPMPSSLPSPPAIQAAMPLSSLTKLEHALEHIPIASNIPLDNALFPFTLLPASHIPDKTASPDEIYEEVVNPILHWVFLTKNRQELADMVHIGQQGVAGFCEFVRYFMETMNVDWRLFEERLERLNDAVNFA